MGHYLSEMQTDEEAEERMSRAADVADRISMGFHHVSATYADIWHCGICECLVLGNRWRQHIDKVHPNV